MSDEHRIEFTGTGSDYFALWIVNLLLTIVTLGIYSPWAKVRRLQYFYRSTRVAGSVFDYHGSPLALLKGRVVALALLGAYYAVGYLSFALAVAILVALAAALPWLIHRSFRFKLHHSSYRGIRLRFNGSLQGAYRVVLIPMVMLALPLGMFGGLGGRLTGDTGSGTLAGVLSGVFALMSIVGLVMLPWFHHALKKYQHGNSALGTTGSTFSARPGAFYGIYLRG
jgi:uncharacterized membrane protein YjgN (DUF898 family)